MTQVAPEFDPNITHPLYFMRRGLYRGVKKHCAGFTGRLLDLGCGTKPYRSLFKVDEYIGVDHENEGHSHINEPIDIFYDGKKLPFKDHEFDCFFSSETFEHIFNLNDILQEINRVVRPGGKLLLTCPFVWNEHEMPNDYARYTLFALRDLLEKNGFKVISGDKTGNFVEVMVQLNILFVTPFFYKIPLLWRMLIPTYCIIVNSFGIVFSRLFSGRKDLYLSNVVLAEKKV